MKHHVPAIFGLKDMRGCVVILLLIHLVKQIQILDAFILSCNASLQTVKRVPMCPSDMSDYEEAVKKKNCSSSAADAHACKSFEYHCVLSDDLKYAIEVCAPGMYIVGYACTKFSTSFRSILRIDDFPCNDSTIQCPYRYNSTLAFRQTLCYSNITYPLTTDSPLSRAGVVKYNATEKTKENDNEELKNSEFLFLFLLLLLSVPLAIGLFICRRRWIEVRRQTARKPHDMEMIVTDPLLNSGKTRKHPHTEDTDATNIGSQLVDIVTLQEPLKGDSEDSTGIGEGDEETYEKRLFSKSSEFSEDFEKKCNKFSSEEPIEYPGYKNYNTRAKSFDGAGNWLEVKKNEFAEFGFLYKGIGLKTACFCCGCFKDDWTKEDNIFETHGFLKKSCLYFQYINTLLMEQK